jgi:nicotinate-nucleotide adenylyltransferase
MIAQQEPDAERFLIMGADSLVDFPNWKSPGEICQLATLLVVARPGVAVDFGPLAPLVSPEQLSEYQEQQLQMPLVGFSSSELRTRVAEGKSIRYWTPRSVEKVIETQGLYRAGE